MIRVAALTSSRNSPASRFRFRQHFAALRQLGVSVTDYVPVIDKYESGRPASTGANIRRSRHSLLSAGWRATKLATRAPGVLGSWRSDLTWLEREILPGYFTLERALKRPLVVDVDDAIWLTPPDGVRSCRRLAERADVVVAGNAYLADWFASRRATVRILPTAIDTDLFVPPADDARRSGPFVVGWIGTKGNLPYLQSIEPALLAFFRARPDARLMVVADGPPVFQQLPPDRVTFVPWSAADEARHIQLMDVGVMPLPDTDWTRGKCGFKMLQYFACGRPAVASPVGVNRDILARGEMGIGATTEDEWTSALVHLYDQRDEARRMGARARQVVEQHYSVRVVAPALAELFKDL